MMSRRSTLQNASLKEPSESTEYPWRKWIPVEGTDSGLDTASHNSNRDVAISNDHEL